MKSSKVIMLSILLCVFLMFTGCGGDVENSDSSANTTSMGKEVSNDKSNGFKKIADMSEAWNDLYSKNERIINNYEGMPVIELASVGMGFISGIQYDLLNMDNKDGRFEGELLMAGYQGFVDKKGSKIVFGYDDVLDKDGFGPNNKAGDRMVENGLFLTDKEYYVSDSFTERNGVKTSRNYYEFKRLKDGSMICFELNASTNDFRGDENIRNNFVFIHLGDNICDFVIASAKTGTEFEKLSLVGKDNLTKEQVVEIAQNAGYTIEKNGGIKDGEFIVE